MPEVSLDQVEVRLDPEFFRKERDQVYADWRLAFWRELFQNAVDQTASRIKIEMRQTAAHTSVVFEDNGPGMSRDVLKNVYFALGATTKSGPDQIGGMGRARILTCFSMNSYSIRSQNYKVTGTGGHAAVKAESVFFRGCRLEMEVPNSTVEEMTAKLHQFIQESNLSCGITLNGELVTMRSAYRGRHVRNLLIDGEGEFAQVFVNKSADKHGLIVRVKGVSMFTTHIRAKARVIVEIDPGKSRTILTANRDGLHSKYNRVLNSFLEELAVDTTSAVKDRFTRHTKVVGKRGMRKMVRKAKPSGKKTTDATVINFNDPLPTHESMALPASISEVVTHTRLVDPLGDWLAATFGDIYIYDETNNAAMHKALPNYLPENWQIMNVDGRRFRKGGNTIKVLLMWHVAISYALEVGLVHLNKNEVDYSVGFVFKNACAAEHRRENNGHVFSLCPVDTDGKLNYSVRERKSLKQMMSSAKHEVAHVACSWHDEEFSSVRESIDEDFDEAECFRRMKDALAAMPDLNQEVMQMVRAA